jgi:activator of HSP90 ATPase
LTIYDLEVESAWIGKDSNGEEVKGTLKVPEVSHEAIDGLSDYVVSEFRYMCTAKLTYQFEFRLTSTENAEAKALLQYIKQAYSPLLKEKFNAFRPALIAAHGQPTSEAPSGASTPNPASSSSYAPAPPAKSESAAKEDKPVASGSKVNNTATVEVKATLQASADDIWGLLTDEKRIPMWSRSAAKVSHCARTRADGR